MTLVLGTEATLQIAANSMTMISKPPKLVVLVEVDCHNMGPEFSSKASKLDNLVKILINQVTIRLLFSWRSNNKLELGGLHSHTIANLALL